jgi:hypothetical protein
MHMHSQAYPAQWRLAFVGILERKVFFHFFIDEVGCVDLERVFVASFHQAAAVLG